MNKTSASPILIIVFLVLIGVFSVSASFAYMENPNVCSKCHAMEPFYESYSDAEDYILIQAHKDEKINCIDCHSPPGRENRDKVRTTILKKILSYVYIGNVVADTSLLKADCTKCHNLDTTFSDTEINPHAGVQSCVVSCHLVHEDLILGDFVEMDCAECHVEPDVGGRHANVDCVGCHPTHGQIPSCTGCHASHDGSNIKVENSECLECHGGSAHTIAVGTYDASSIIQMDACGACHEEQYKKLVNSMHGNMDTCVGCHPQHGDINPCLECHYSNHMGAHASLMDDTASRCMVCHNSGGGIHKACIDCHIKDPHTI
ncbi:MAG TPA: hypothetical protein C5S51_07465 [Methanosarcinaceae archaeon]|nr:hypothetical protein [Methanosarcinaceae archaeon]